MGGFDSRVVLCVDDSAIMQRVCQITFRGSGWTYVGARTVREALEQARTAQPSLILVDAAMPDGNGYDLCRALRAEPGLAEVPIFLLCGNSTAYDPARGAQAGADGAITKPWETDTLLHKLGELSSRRRAAPAAPPAAAAPRPVPAKAREVLQYSMEVAPAAPVSEEAETPPPWLAPGESLGAAGPDRSPAAAAERKERPAAALKAEDWHMDASFDDVEVHSRGLGAAAPEQRAPYVDENVQFTVYRPRAVAPWTWHRLLAFAHLSDKPPDAPDAADPLDQVRQEAEALLGKRAGDYQDVTQDSSHAIPRMGELTFVPEMAGVTFNPPRASLLWLEPVHRVDFKLRASPSLQGKTARGRMTVFLGGIILAEIALTIRVDAGARAADARPEPAQARAYRRIFASYSHRDAAIVDQFETYARSLGDEYLRDWVHLRSGEVWTERLRGLIEQADVFQLFWSRNSMQSPFVRQEWEYALSLGRPRFVRPTYWEEPLPGDPSLGLPPPELQELHFQRIGFPTPAAPAASSVAGSAAQPPDPDGPDAKRTQPAIPSQMAARAEPEAEAARRRSLLPVLLLLLLLCAAGAGYYYFYFLPAT